MSANTQNTLQSYRSLAAGLTKWAAKATAAYCTVVVTGGLGLGHATQAIGKCVQGDISGAAHEAVIAASLVFVSVKACGAATRVDKRAAEWLATQGKLQL
jgi:hypothetical protein